MAAGGEGKPRATVVITNYNYARFVGPAIESVLDQTEPVQLVVVDDGSTDDSLSVINQYHDRFPGRLTVVAQANGGQGAAFNAGFEQARGDVIFFLDGDDELVPDAVATVVAAFDASPDSPRAQFRMSWIDAGGKPVEGSFPESFRLLPAGDLRQTLTVSPDDIPWQPTTGNAFRASVLARILPMPTEPYRISADHYLSNLSALYGPVLAIERNLARYRVHGENADHRNQFDLGRQRSILARTEQTRRHLIERGRELGLPMPDTVDGFSSVTTAAMRLISSRFEGHPYPRDSRWDLVRAVAVAAGGRGDFSLPRRAGASVWAAAVAYAPVRAVPALSARVLTR